MRIIFFAHPQFPGSRSMNIFCRMLADGMLAKGHSAEVWSPAARCSRLKTFAPIRKWLSYIDQFMIFPAQIRKKIKDSPADTLFVFCDHALGPWIPLVSKRPVVVHCHDFLAQLSAEGKYPENRTSWTGKIYQRLIRNGFQQADNFISVSESTRNQLAQFLKRNPVISEVVYNSLNPVYRALNPLTAREYMTEFTGINLLHGYILHVGGSFWYKNRTGLIEIYTRWRSICNQPLPLLMIGDKSDRTLMALIKQSPVRNDIYFLANVSDTTLQQAYSGATAFLFPSLAEGFGWPIAEAMACGCPVITTSENAMLETAGNAAFLIQRKPGSGDTDQWKTESARVLEKCVQLNEAARDEVIEKGFMNVKRFGTNLMPGKIERIYYSVLANAGVQ